MNIVLAHGILGFKRIPILNLDYFNGVKAYLEDKFQVRVLVTKVDPVAGIEKCSDQFQERIMVALGKTGAEPTLDPSEKVHIIAHSMGGPDARYLLSKNANGIADYVSTLTTIGTPHQGLADFCYSLLDGESNIPFMGTLVGALEKGV
jgi:triacylglycerol lipase